jgi:hypothetical protein
LQQIRGLAHDDISQEEQALAQIGATLHSSIPDSLATR